MFLLAGTVSAASKKPAPLPMIAAVRASRTVLRSRALPATATRLYHPNIVDHYESPRNVGSLDKKDKNVGTGLVGAPA